LVYWLYGEEIYVERKDLIVICDLQNKAKWVIFKDGTVLLDIKYIKEWNIANRG